MTKFRVIFDGIAKKQNEIQAAEKYSIPAPGATIMIKVKNPVGEKPDRE
jgi:hypothetical protein